MSTLTTKHHRFIRAIEQNTQGLTAVSTGPCPGCEQCRDEYGDEVPCYCHSHPGCEGEPDTDCEHCDGRGMRKPTMAEFDEQWSNGSVVCEGEFSWHGCDLCGSSLGGTFEPWHAVDSNGDIVHGEHACVDCVMYLANGDLPE